MLQMHKCGGKESPNQKVCRLQTGSFVLCQHALEPGIDHSNTCLRMNKT